LSSVMNIGTPSSPTRLRWLPLEVELCSVFAKAHFGSLLFLLEDCLCVGFFAV
jgi:hypothetical protein